MAELKSFPLDYYRNYLDVDDCSLIYKHCNGKQFEAATKLDLCEFLNLRTPLVAVRILDGEKQRMCYLISQLLKLRVPAISEMKKPWLKGILARVPAISEMKKPWLKGILAACKISESYYKSHYNDVDERSGSEANKEFYRTVKSILGR